MEEEQVQVKPILKKKKKKRRRRGKWRHDQIERDCERGGRRRGAIPDRFEAKTETESSNQNGRCRGRFVHQFEISRQKKRCRRRVIRFAGGPPPRGQFAVDDGQRAVRQPTNLRQRCRFHYRCRRPAQEEEEDGLPEDGGRRGRLRRPGAYDQGKSQQEFNLGLLNPSRMHSIPVEADERFLPSPRHPHRHYRERALLSPWPPRPCWTASKKKRWSRSKATNSSRCALMSDTSTCIAKNAAGFASSSA